MQVVAAKQGEGAAVAHSRCSQKLGFLDLHLRSAVGMPDSLEMEMGSAPVKDGHRRCWDGPFENNMWCLVGSMGMGATVIFLPVSDCNVL